MRRFLLSHPTFGALLLAIAVGTAACSGGGDRPESLDETPLPDSGMHVVDAWARPGIDRGMSAVYMRVMNADAVADTLLGVSGEVAELVEIHESYRTEEGLMGMRAIESLEVPAKSSVILQQGGLHVMLIQLRQDLTTGDTVDLTLRFSRNGEVPVRAPVRIP